MGRALRAELRKVVADAIPTFPPRHVRGALVLEPSDAPASSSSFLISLSDERPFGSRTHVVVGRVTGGEATLARMEAAAVEAVEAAPLTAAPTVEMSALRPSRRPPVATTGGHPRRDCSRACHCCHHHSPPRRIDTSAKVPLAARSHAQVEILSAVMMLSYHGQLILDPPAARGGETSHETALRELPSPPSPPPPPLVSESKSESGE